MARPGDSPLLSALIVVAPPPIRKDVCLNVAIQGDLRGWWDVAWKLFVRLLQNKEALPGKQGTLPEKPSRIQEELPQRRWRPPKHHLPCVSLQVLIHPGPSDPGRSSWGRCVCALQDLKQKNVMFLNEQEPLKGSLGSEESNKDMIDGPIKASGPSGDVSDNE